MRSYIELMSDIKTVINCFYSNTSILWKYNVGKAVKIYCTINKSN